MRKAVLTFGLGYILWGLWLLLSVIRLISLYQGFGTTTLFPALSLPGGVLGYGVIEIVCYFVNFQSRKVYPVLFIFSIVFIGLWVIYVLRAGSIANEQIETILNKVS